MGQYFITTLINGIIKIAPILAFAVGGYLIFIKLPFLFLKKSMHDQKAKLNEENKGLKVVEEKYTLDDYKDFQKKIKLINGTATLPDPEARKTQRPEEAKKERPKKEQTQRQQQQQKKETPKRPAEKTATSLSDEEILGFKPGDRFTMSELKKRYIDLIRQNHPDKVASMGPDFKNLAEKNTKEINKAYDKLKKKAS
jgi:type IV secretory pathway VirB10-like protein